MEGEIVKAEQMGHRLGGSGKPSLVRKLSEVMGEVGHVPKSGRNEFHRYDYATEADIVAAVRKGMASRALMLVPSVEKSEVHEIDRSKGGKDRIATLTVRFTVHDGESGEEMAFIVLGEGQDTGDKATYKAMTGATKYALLKLFLIPTGDDPERDEPPPKKSKDSAPRHPVDAPIPPTPRPSTSEAKSKPAARKGIDDLAKIDRSKEGVGFGSHKSKMIGALTDDQLFEAVDEAAEWLSEYPEHFARNAVLNKQDLLALEVEAREKRATAAVRDEAKANMARDGAP